MTQAQANYRTVNDKLVKLGWDWSHPRIVAYISDLNLRNKANYSISKLPSKHYHRLFRCLDLYEQIDKTLKACNASWSDAAIVDFFARYSEKDINGNSTNRLKVCTWIALEQFVRHSCIPF